MLRGLVKGCVKLVETLREGQSERLRERLAKWLDEMLSTRLHEMLF